MELFARSTTQRRGRTCNTLRGHELARRRDLFPAEPDHPRADQVYYKLQLGPLIELELPINSLRWRRITFIVICPWRWKY